jgi:hypothetical protein
MSAGEGFAFGCWGRQQEHAVMASGRAAFSLSEGGRHAGF